MTEQKKKSTPMGTEPTRLNVPAATMQAIRDEAAREGCSMNHIATQVLNAYARGEIKRAWSPAGGEAKK